MVTRYQKVVIELCDRLVPIIGDRASIWICVPLGLPCYTLGRMKEESSVSPSNSS